MKPLDLVEFAKLIADLLALFYNFGCLGFLTKRHYGQVTTTAGHIFELNVLFNNTMKIFLWILLVDSGLQDNWCTLSDLVLTISSYSSLVAIAGAQIETAIFLKTLNVNTMMTNTAAKIVLGMLIFASGMGVLSTMMVLPSPIKVCQTETFCKIFMKYGYQMTIPASLVLVIVFMVMGFTIFRSHQFKKKRHMNCNQNRGEMNKTEGRKEDALNIEPSQGQGRTFNTQEAASKFHRRSLENPKTPSANVEDDIVIEDIETPSSSPSSVSIGVMIHEITNLENTLTENQQSTCLPGIGFMMQTLNKYFRNTLMSLLMLSYLLPWNLTALYGKITNSDCENSTYRFMIEMDVYYYILMFNILLPFLIKLKLDRLSN